MTRHHAVAQVLKVLDALELIADERHAFNKSLTALAREASHHTDASFHLRLDYVGVDRDFAVHSAPHTLATRYQRSEESGITHRDLRGCLRLLPASPSCSISSGRCCSRHCTPVCATLHMRKRSGAARALR